MIAKTELALLALIVLSCWIGCAGMVRMRTPIQALHYLALPSAIGAALLPLAMLCAAGWSIATVKAALIAFFLIATNSVVAHATARVIRVRRTGHWEAREGDRIEFLGRGES